MPPEFVIVVCVLAAAFLVLRRLGVFRGFLERWRLMGPRLVDLDRMDGDAFEDWLQRRLERGGFQVERTRHGGDFGLDFVITDGKRRVGIEAKRRRETISNAVIRSVASGCLHHECGLGAVITQSRYSREARQQAQTAPIPIMLIGRDDLPDLSRVLWDGIRAGGQRP